MCVAKVVLHDLYITCNIQETTLLFFLIHSHTAHCILFLITANTDSFSFLPFLSRHDNLALILKASMTHETERGWDKRIYNYCGEDCLTDLCMGTIFTDILDTSAAGSWPTLLPSSLLLRESSSASSFSGLPKQLPPNSTGTGSNSPSYILRSITWHVAE